MGDPFQMAELHGLSMAMILTTYKSWDDPPSTWSRWGGACCEVDE